jgi:hypothetical protein
MSSTFTSPIRRAALVSSCLFAAAVPAVASAVPTSQSATTHITHTISIGQRLHAHRVGDMLRLTGVVKQPKNMRGYLYSSVSAKVSFEMMGAQHRSALVTARPLTLHTSNNQTVRFAVSVRDQHLPGLYRLEIVIRAPGRSFVISGLHPVAGACLFSSGPAGSPSSGGCTTVMTANATR